MASDDLVCPALSMGLARFGWTAVLCAYTAHVEIFLAEKRECHGHSAVVVVLCLLILLGTASAVSLVWLAYESSRGRMLEKGARRRVPGLVRTTAVLSIIEGLASCGLMYVAWAPKEEMFCTRVLRGDPFERIALRTLTTFQVVGLGTAIISAIVFFDPAGSRRIDATDTIRGGENLEIRLIPGTDEERWQVRCHSLCGCASRMTCGVFGGKGIRRRDGDTVAALQEVAALVSRYLGGLDVVASDIAAGLALLRARQRAVVKAQLHRSASRGSSLAQERQVRAQDVDMRRFACAVADDAKLGAADAEKLSEAAHVIDIALGVYGWKLLSVMAPFRAIGILVIVVLSHLCCCCRCCCSSSSSNDNDKKVCCDGLDERALQYRVGAKRQVLYASFKAVPNKRVPTAIIKDDERRLLIVACRGTLSFEDAVTDATAKPTKVVDLEDEEEFLAHSGMLAVARKTVDVILPILRRELDQEAPYDVVICGHSLGAGVAALVTLALRARGTMARCIAYSPPGALVDATLAENMKPFCLSIVVGDDLVPRLGLKALVDLRDDVLRAVASCATHKRTAIASFPKTFPDDTALFYPPGSALFDEANRLADASVAALKRTGPDETVLFPLVAPGTIYHLVTVLPEGGRRSVDATGSAGGPCFLCSGGFCCSLPSIFSRSPSRGGRRRMITSLVTPRGFFTTIRIARRMFGDHMPWVVADAVRRAAQDAHTNSALDTLLDDDHFSSHGTSPGGDSGGSYAPPRPLFLATSADIPSVPESSQQPSLLTQSSSEPPPPPPPPL